MNKTLQKVLQHQVIQQQTSGKIAADVLPGYASKIAPAPSNGAGCSMVQGSNSKMILPENQRVISAVLPAGKIPVPTAVPCGLSIEETVTVQIDMTGQGLTLNKIPVILFDEANYHKSKNGIASAYPAGTVYIGSAARNIYPSWVSELCGHTFLFNAVKIDVSVAAGAAASAELQFAEMIRIFNHNTRTAQESQIEVANFVDAGSYNQSVRTIPLTDEKARVDRRTTWAMDVYEGVKVTLTFFNNMMIVG